MFWAFLMLCIFESRQIEQINQKCQAKKEVIDRYFVGTFWGEIIHKNDCAILTKMREGDVLRNYNATGTRKEAELV